MKVKKLLLGLVVLVGGLVLVRGAWGLTYTEEVDLVFDFDPALSISVSGDLLIDGLVPGTADYSNTISVTVNTNNPTGYTLSARAGDGSSSAAKNLVHRDDANSVFSMPDPRSEGTPKILADFNDNMWGVSTATTIVPSTTTFFWFRFAGENINATSDAAGTAKSGSFGDSSFPGGNVTSFTIGAKAAADRIAGDYTNVITFTAVANHVPVNISSLVYMQDFANLTSSEKTEVLVSMTSGTEYRLRDSRDGQNYYVSRQSDNNIWMTQNLDLCICCSGTASLTSENTDLNTAGEAPYSLLDGYAEDATTSVITWSPDATAVTSSHPISGRRVSQWSESTSAPYSAEGGEVYIYTSGSNDDDIVYDSLSACRDGGHSELECASGHVGNYYNWPAAIASNNSSALTTQYAVADNSICPAGWRLPKGAGSAVNGTNYEFGNLYKSAGIIANVNSTNYSVTSGSNASFIILRKSPLYFVRGGVINTSAVLDSRAQYGYYWSSTTYSNSVAYSTRFREYVRAPNIADGKNIDPALSAPSFGAGPRSYRSLGIPVRCIVRK